MIKVKMHPHPTKAQGQVGGIQRVVEAYGKHLPKFDVQIVPMDSENYDLRVGHAGSLGSKVDVETSHGLWWTADMPNVKDSHFRGNRKCIDALRAAKEITVPSPWVAHNIAREMHVYPHVVPHGIDYDEWDHNFKSDGYVLWNKGRAKDVCDPTPVKELAERAGNVQFISTFCLNPPNNVRVIGRTPFREMKGLVQRAGVYLATTKETFSIGVLEAMASGVPTLAWDWGMVPNLIDHRETGYIAQVGNYENLISGLDFCIRNRKRLGNTAREAAKKWDWETPCEMIADIYRSALDKIKDENRPMKIDLSLYARRDGT